MDNENKIGQKLVTSLCDCLVDFLNHYDAEYLLNHITPLLMQHLCRKHTPPAHPYTVKFINLAVYSLFTFSVSVSHAPFPNTPLVGLNHIHCCLTIKPTTSITFIAWYITDL